jgi:hypothetical protein
MPTAFLNRLTDDRFRLYIAFDNVIYAAPQRTRIWRNQFGGLFGVANIKDRGKISINPCTRPAKRKVLPDVRRFVFLKLVVQKLADQVLTFFALHFEQSKGFK